MLDFIRCELMYEIDIIQVEKCVCVYHVLLGGLFVTSHMCCYFLGMFTVLVPPSWMIIGMTGQHVNLN